MDISLHAVASSGTILFSRIVGRALVPIISGMLGP